MNARVTASRAGSRERRADGAMEQKRGRAGSPPPFEFTLKKLVSRAAASRALERHGDAVGRAVARGVDAAHLDAERTVRVRADFDFELGLHAPIERTAVGGERRDRA